MTIPKSITALVDLSTLLVGRNLANTPFAGQHSTDIVHELVTGAQSLPIAQRATFHRERCLQAASYLESIGSTIPQTRQQSLSFYRDELQALGQEPHPQSRAVFVRKALGVEVEASDPFAVRYYNLSSKARASLYILLADESEGVVPVDLLDALANDTVFKKYGHLWEMPIDLFSLFVRGYGFDFTRGDLLVREVEDPIVDVLSRWEHALFLALHSDVTEIELNKSYDVNWDLLLPDEMDYITRYVLPRLSKTARESYREQHYFRAHLYAANAENRWLTAIINNPEKFRNKANVLLEVYRYVLTARAQEAALEIVVVSDKKNRKFIETLRTILVQADLPYSLRTRGKTQLAYGEFQYAVRDKKDAKLLKRRRALPPVPDSARTGPTPFSSTGAEGSIPELDTALAQPDPETLQQIYSALTLYVGAGTLHYDPNDLPVIDMALSAHLEVNLGWPEQDVQEHLPTIRQQALEDICLLTPLKIPEGFQWCENVSGLRDPFTREELNVPELAADLWREQERREFWSLVRAVPKENGDLRYLVNSEKLTQHLKREGLKERTKHTAERMLEATVLGGQVSLLSLETLKDYLFQSGNPLKRFSEIQTVLEPGFNPAADVLVLSGTLLQTTGSEPHVQGLRLHDEPVTAGDNRFQLSFSRDGEAYRLHQISGAHAMELGAAWFAGDIKSIARTFDSLSLALLATIWDTNIAISHSDIGRDLKQRGIADRWELLRKAAPRDQYPEATPDRLYLVGTPHPSSEAQGLYSRLSLVTQHDGEDVPEVVIRKFSMRELNIPD